MALSGPSLAFEQSDDTRQIRCLAEAIHGEARGEPNAGKIAVGNVIINRTQSRGFRNTICGVVDQPGQFTYPRTGRADANSVNIANAIYTRALNDNTYGAQYYHARYVNPAWSRRFAKTAVIGNHIFYRS